MTTTIKKNDEFKTIQTEDLSYYKSIGWEETAEKPAPFSKKARKRSYEEETKEEE